MDRLLRAIAAVPPQLPAFDDGVRRVSYGELGACVGLEAAWLAEHGVQRCALLAENGCGWAIADLALFAQHVVNLPLPTFFTAAQRRHALDDAGVDAVLTDRADRVLGQQPDFRPAGVAPCSGLELLVRPRAGPARPLPPDTVKITYTSGSTGTPKGVCLSATTLLAVSESLAGAVRGAGVTRHLCLLPLSTLLENLTAVYVPLLLGASALLPPSERTGMRYGQFEPGKLVAAIAGSGAHSLVLVPELLRVLIAGARASGGFPSLRFVAVGGATVSPALLAEAGSLGLPVYEGYGLSECGSVVCLNTPGANRVGSVGRPLPHVRVRVDADGEIHVAGPGPEIATGDLGEIDADGFVYVRGRRRNRFITSFGRNVTPEWVERELLNEPLLSQAMVTGEARPWVAALLWPRPGAGDAASIAAAVARANARLPDYAQVRAWACIEESPAELAGLLTANGRLRRDAVLARHGAQLESLYEEPEVVNA